MAAVVCSPRNFVGNKPNIAAIFDSSSGRLYGEVTSFFSKWPISLWSSGLRGFGTGLQIRVFREAYEHQRKGGSGAPLEQARSTEFEIAISRFDTFRPSQPVTQPERVGTFSLKLPYIIGFSCVCPKSIGSRKRQPWRDSPKVSSPNRRNSRFRGDDWRRLVRSTLSGRVGSEFWAILPARFTAKSRCCTGNNGQSC